MAVVAISSNDVAQYPEDGPAGMAAFAAAHGFTFPYLYDETQAVAREYQAACTPDFFLFDAERRLVYRGQLDGARPANDVPIDGRDLRAALDADAGRLARTRAAAGERGLQHQVEAGHRADVRAGPARLTRGAAVQPYAAGATVRQAPRVASCRRPRIDATLVDRAVAEDDAAPRGG